MIDTDSATFSQMEHEYYNPMEYEVEACDE